MSRSVFSLMNLTHTGIFRVNCKERTTYTNSSEVKPDLCEDQDQQCSVKYKSKWKADRTAKVNFNALTLAVRSAFHLEYFDLTLAYGDGEDWLHRVSAFVICFFDKLEDFMQVYSGSLIHVVTAPASDVSFARDARPHSASRAEKPSTPYGRIFVTEAVLPVLTAPTVNNR